MSGSGVVRRRVAHPGGGRQMTKQGDALKSDVNSIMAKWIRDGVAPAVGKEPRYGDFSNSVDYHTALNRCHDADREFNALPVAVRKHCENDPGEFLKMVYDPERGVSAVVRGFIRRTFVVVRCAAAGAFKIGCSAPGR